MKPTARALRLLSTAIVSAFLGGLGAIVFLNGYAVPVIIVCALILAAIGSYAYIKRTRGGNDTTLLPFDVHGMLSLYDIKLRTFDPQTNTATYRLPRGWSAMDGPPNNWHPPYATRAITVYNGGSSPRAVCLVVGLPGNWHIVPMDPN